MRVVRTELAHGRGSCEHQERFAEVLAPAALKPRRRQFGGRCSSVLVVKRKRGSRNASGDSSCVLERPGCRDLQCEVINNRSRTPGGVKKVAYLSHELVREQKILRKCALSRLLGSIVPTLDDTKGGYNEHRTRVK